MGWLQNSKNYNGLDSRGNSFVNSKELGIDFNHPLNNITTITAKNDGKNFFIFLAPHFYQRLKMEAHPQSLYL